jgi:phage recombination protein Bet
MANIVQFGEIISQDQIQLVKDTICRGASDNELQMFISICNKTGLDPFSKQCWAVKRWDSGLGREVMAFQTGVDGFRVIANRSDKYSGQLGPFWCDETGEWKDVWLSDKPPVAAKVGVLRADFKEPLWGVAKFSSYAARKKDGSLTPFWVKMPDLMIAKVAECLALRKAFPQDLSGINSDDELDRAETDFKNLEPDKTFQQLKDEATKSIEQSCGVTPEQSTQTKEPERFPKPEQILITREQADQMKSFGLTQGWTMEQMAHFIYTEFKLIRWGEMNQIQFAAMEKHIGANPK